MDRPLTGWGTAGFMTRQGLFSHHGDAPWQVKLTGGTLANNAHSFPLQYAADFGIPAFVVLLMFVAWLWGPAAGRAVVLHPNTTLMSRAACGLLVAVCVSSIASPAFDLTSIIIWVALLAGTLIGTDDSVAPMREQFVSAGTCFVLLTTPALFLFPTLKPKMKAHTLSLTISKYPKGIGDIAAVKAMSTSDGGVDSSFPGTDFLVPELAVTDPKGNIVRVVPVSASFVRWTFNRRTNTDADAILEITVPPVDIKPGEGLELGISGTLTYVDGERRTAGVSIPVVAQ